MLIISAHYFVSSAIIVQLLMPFLNLSHGYNMLEYVFFHQQPLGQFCEFLRGKGIPFQLLDSSESLLLAIEEQSIDDPMADIIDEYYDEMLDLDQSIYDQGMVEDEENYASAGVVVNLMDGQSIYADVPGNLLKKIMDVLSPQELGDLVNAIADAVENPDKRTLCKRHADAS